MSNVNQSQFVSQEDAAAVRDAGENVVKLVVQLSALGLKAPALMEYVTAVADGNEPSASLGVGRPKPVTIQLYSFLRDARQYNGVYGMSEERAAALRTLAASDLESARDEVAQFVSASPRTRASGRAVEVSTVGMPGTSNPGASPLVGAHSVTASYAQEIASNSGVYGAYKFDAFDTRREETQRFAVDLGANFFVLAHSKKLAISVARVTRVKGRTDPLAMPYVFYVDRTGKCVGNGDIPAESWMCACGPRDEPPSQSSRFPKADDSSVTQSVSQQPTGMSVVGTSPPKSSGRAPTPKMGEKA
ncbi:putative capsid protein [Fusarium redolens polymycovirus 1]|uniref:Putative capsid protein n=1 Tax=Fusarium redolens polymycovirus 1 TaxID=2546034 RepID=A0A513ZVE6_9VIRU|nr:putative capsid protein [Fusarium redolens polymycovirus 1]QDH44659.1 putative capsid protein [Fusarium redolens polymycovirus 1]